MLQGPGLFQQEVNGYLATNALAEFIALVHAPYFLQVRIATAAPRLDRGLWEDLHDYKNIFPDGSIQADMADAAMESLLRHTWYLTEELVVFAFWDDQVSAPERVAMARKLLSTNPPPVWQTGKPSLPDQFPPKPKLQNLIGERSWLVFHLLRIGTAWLRRPVSRWRDDAEYVRVGDFLKDLQVVNDTAERCIKDVTEYAYLAKDSAHREDILLVVSDHRHVIQDIRKQALDRN